MRSFSSARAACAHGEWARPECELGGRCSMRSVGLSLCALLGCAASRPSAAPSATHTTRSLADAAPIADAGPVAPQATATPAVTCLDHAATAGLLSCSGRGSAAVAWDEQRWQTLGAQQSSSSRRARVAPSLEPRELGAAEQELVALGAAYLCVDRTSSERGPFVYRMARAYYDAQQFDAAATMDRVVVLGPGSDSFDRALREFAADLYMDSLNVLASRVEPRRPSCIDAMREDLPQIRAALCAGRATGAGDFCDRADRLACQLEAHARERSRAASLCSQPRRR